jgi:hypothetical protein
MEGVRTVALCLGSKCPLAEPEDNFVTVHVSARAFVEFSIEGQPGSMGPVTATFKVYRQQPVVVNARILGGALPLEFGDELWDPITFGVFVDHEVLTWVTIQTLMEKEYYWFPDVSMLAYRR